jgi:ABC-type transporter MlaC component
MKRILIACFLSTVIILSALPAVAADVVLDYARTAYASLTGMDKNSSDFARQTAQKMRTLFDVDGLAGFAMQDIKSKISEGEYQDLSAIFADVFFANIERKADQIAARRLKNPTFSVRESQPELVVVEVAGLAATGQATMAFYFKPIGVGEWKLVDLEIESVRLSRNYRGAFNRIFREKGYGGLKEKLAARLKELMPITAP